VEPYKCESTQVRHQMVDPAEDGWWNGWESVGWVVRWLVAS
jgi:hypothetical protein